MDHTDDDTAKYYPSINTLRPRQNWRHFANDIFKCIFLNESVWIPIKISLKFIPRGPINNIQALVQMMAWRRPGDKPLSEAMVVSLPTHICVTRPQWVINTIYWTAMSYHQHVLDQRLVWVRDIEFEYYILRLKYTKAFRNSNNTLLVQYFGSWWYIYA